MTDPAGVTSRALAKPYGGHYPSSNNLIAASPSTGVVINSSLSFPNRGYPSPSSGGYSGPSSGHVPPSSSASISSRSAILSGLNPPFPYPTSYSSDVASGRSFFSGAYGSPPTATGQAPNGISPYPYPSAAGYGPSGGGPIHFATGGFYPARNGTRIVRHSTDHITEHIPQIVAPCTINAIGANVYYWDTSSIEVTKCPTGIPSDECTNKPTTQPYSLGAPATRIISTWTSARPIWVPKTTWSETILISEVTNPIYTKTNYHFPGDTVAYSKITSEDFETAHGECKCTAFLVAPRAMKPGCKAVLSLWHDKAMQC